MSRSRFRTGLGCQVLGLRCQVSGVRLRFLDIRILIKHLTAWGEAARAGAFAASANPGIEGTALQHAARLFKTVSLSPET